MSTRRKVIVSYSELDTFRQCPLKHELGWRQGWYKEPDEKRKRGSNWHEIMQTHYKTLADMQRKARSRVVSLEARRPLAAAREAIEPLLYDHETGTQTEQQVLLEWMYDGYVQMWRNDPDWWVDAIETSFVVPLPAVTPGLGKTLSKRYFLKVRIDLIIRDRRGNRWVVDHKTSQNLKNKLELDIDDQFGLYTWACRTRGIKVMGAVHNGARTQRNKSPMLLSDRFRREPTLRTETELWNLATDAARTAQAIYGHPDHAPYSAPDPDRCKWKCDFIDVHLEMRRGAAPNQALKDYGFIKRERLRA